MEDKNWCVYIHTNKTNGKRYVGITGQEPERRWRNGEGYSTQPFYAAIKKYGWDGFEHEIVAQNLTCKQAENMEKELIAKYHSLIKDGGYNIRQFGSFPGYRRHFHQDPSSKYPIYQFDLQRNFLQEYPNALDAAKKHDMWSSGAILMSCRSNAHTAYGYVWRFKKDVPDIEKFKADFDRQEQIKKERDRIYQFDIDGKFIKEYDNFIEASTAVKCNPYQLRDCCLGKYKTTMGYIWKFEYEYKQNPHIEPYHMPNSKAVLQFDMNGCFISEYPSTMVAERQTGCSYKSINRVCRGGKLTTHNFIWRYKSDFDEIPEKIEPYHDPRKHPVCQFTPDLEFVQEYESTEEAARQTGFTATGINFVCTGEKKTSHGYIWARTEDILREGGINLWLVQVAQ